MVVLLLLVSLATFIQAIPETSRLDSGCCAPGSGPLAKDFSAYYVAAWRIIHDPPNLYTKGSVSDGGPQISPQPQEYKYLPYFLAVIIPLLLLPYNSALLAFDLMQFLLLPLTALLTYLIIKDRGLLATSAVEALVLVLPLPLPGWGLSAPYYWQWGEGQAKVLVTFLLVLELCLAKYRHPRLAGVACALSAFDPRFALLAAPLMLSYSKGSWRKVASAFIATFFFLNIPLALPGVALGLLGMLEAGGASTLPFYYSWIPVVAVVSLTVADWRLVSRRLGPELSLLVRKMKPVRGRIDRDLTTSVGRPRSWALREAPASPGSGSRAGLDLDAAPSEFR